LSQCTKIVHTGLRLSAISNLLCWPGDGNLPGRVTDGVKIHLLRDGVRVRYDTGRARGWRQPPLCRASHAASPHLAKWSSPNLDAGCTGWGAPAPLHGSDCSRLHGLTGWTGCVGCTALDRRDGLRRCRYLALSLVVNAWNDALEMLSIRKASLIAPATLVLFNCLGQVHVTTVHAR
jgi:hypothetical protein